MVRSELIKRLVRDNPGLHANDAQRIVAAFFDEIIERLSANSRVELRGFGTFSTRPRRARNGRNPRTGEKVAVSAKRAPFFRSSDNMRLHLTNVERPSS